MPGRITPETLSSSLTLCVVVVDLPVASPITLRGTAVATSRMVLNTVVIVRADAASVTCTCNERSTKRISIEGIAASAFGSSIVAATPWIRILPANPEMKISAVLQGL